MQHTESDDIFFFGTKTKLFYLSNFYKSTFICNGGIKFNCSEQYFMYQKWKQFDCSNTQISQKILLAISSPEIKKYGRQIKNYDETIWQQVRYSKMLDGLRLKFNQNETIKQKLIDTFPKQLYEASPYDKIWGIGYSIDKATTISKDKFGQNLLGKALMELRTELLSQT